MTSSDQHHLQLLLFYLCQVLHIIITLQTFFCTFKTRRAVSLSESLSFNKSEIYEHQQPALSNSLCRKSEKRFICIHLINIQSGVLIFAVNTCILHPLVSGKQPLLHLWGASQLHVLKCTQFKMSSSAYEYICLWLSLSPWEVASKDCAVGESIAALLPTPFAHSLSLPPHLCVLRNTLQTRWESSFYRLQINFQGQTTKAHSVFVYVYCGPCSFLHFLFSLSEWNARAEF